MSWYNHLHIKRQSADAKSQNTETGRKSDEKRGLKFKSTATRDGSNKHGLIEVIKSKYLDLNSTIKWSVFNESSHRVTHTHTHTHTHTPSRSRWWRPAGFRTTVPRLLRSAETGWRRRRTPSGRRSNTPRRSKSRWTSSGSKGCRFLRGREGEMSLFPSTEI